MRPTRIFAVVLGLLVVAAGCAAVAGSEPDGAQTSRTDHQTSGNRLARGSGLATSRVDLPGVADPTWVLASPASDGLVWLVVSEDGKATRIVAERGPQLPDDVVDRLEVARLGRLEPPIASINTAGSLIVASAIDARTWFKDAIPGARAVHAANGSIVALTSATTRYEHAVLGDAVEAASISILGSDGNVVDVPVGPEQVIEGLSPILADLDGDGIEEIIATVSDADNGARLVAWDLDGQEVARSEPIGQGFRWLHQIGAGPTGPNAEIEIIAVRTPHIGGVVEAYRLTGDRLRLVASAPGFSSHRLGSPNLDMSLLADLDGDGDLDIVVPTQDMRALGALRRVADGFELMGTLELDERLSTNVAAALDADGRLVLAAATSDGVLRIFR